MAVYNAKKLTITKDGNTYIIDPLQGNETAFIDFDVTIESTDWTGNGPYTYEYTNSHITRYCVVFVYFKPSAAGSDITYLFYEKEQGKVTFTTPDQLDDDLDLVVRIAEANVEGVFPISADVVETDAVVGETDVQGALEDLDERIGQQQTIWSVVNGKVCINYEKEIDA